MADTGNPATDLLIDLAHFKASNSRDGRLLHYAQGRIRGFWLRQTLTLFGASTIYLLSSEPLGLALAVIALSGEAFDVSA